VVAASGGNHGVAVAYAAMRRAAVGQIRAGAGRARGRAGLRGEYHRRPVRLTARGYSAAVQPNMFGTRSGTMACVSKLAIKWMTPANAHRRRQTRYCAKRPAARTWRVRAVMNRDRCGLLDVRYAPIA
jgi:hypothetical protein